MPFFSRREKGYFSPDTERGGEAVKVKIAVLIAMLMLMLALAAPAFARGPGTDDCIKYRVNVLGYSHRDAAAICRGVD